MSETSKRNSGEKCAINAACKMKKDMKGTAGKQTLAESGLGSLKKTVLHICVESEETVGAAADYLI